MNCMEYYSRLLNSNREERLLQICKINYVACVLQSQTVRIDQMGLQPSRTGQQQQQQTLLPKLKLNLQRKYVNTKRGNIYSE